MYMLHADIRLLMLFPIFCPTSPKRENNMWNWKMVFIEGFKDIWNLEYILKVIFSSNYVIMVKLLENVKHKINMLPDRKWQKTLSCVSMWVKTCVHAHVACVEAYRLQQYIRTAFTNTRNPDTLCTRIKLPLTPRTLALNMSLYFQPWKGISYHCSI